jgi:hypothetical protein
MSADIDIDMPDRTALLQLIQHTSARLVTQEQVRKHNSGIYPTSIPYDPINNCAAIDYEEAEKRGYFKIDFLNMGVYKLIRDPEHYEQMIAQEPTWSRLWTDSTWASQIVHIGNYTDLLNSMKPDTIPKMAAFISIIRPGKAHLQNQSWSTIFNSVWDGDDSRGFVFKKSHSIGYSMLVKLHMNLLENS